MDDDPSGALVQLALVLAADAADIVMHRPVAVSEQTPPKLTTSQLDDIREVGRNGKTELQWSSPRAVDEQRGGG